MSSRAYSAQEIFQSLVVGTKNNAYSVQEILNVCFDGIGLRIMDKSTISGLSMVIV